MNLVKFPLASTSIFPMANSTRGGQLLTEQNQLCRDTVANHSNIPYVCGPSYTHSSSDFEISAVEGSHVITISAGTALVHGHFIHAELPISIDISEENAALPSANRVSGELAIGLRAMYSNPNTIAASLETDDGECFTGVQIVILKETQFFLPEDNGSGTYTPESQVTAHLKLGTFNYSTSSGISNVVSNPDKHRCLDGDKISNIDDLLDSIYLKKTGLDSEKLYILSGKSQDWTDATDSAIIWDANPQTQTINDPVKAIWLKDGDVSGSNLLTESAVRYDYTTDQLKMVLPHKQIDGMQNTSGVDKYYTPKEVVIPAANRATGAGGVLDASWVNFLNGLDDKIATMYRMPGGKMRKFISVLTDKSQLPQPPIGYYTEQTRNSAYYDNRLQYSFNLLQTQVAQLNSKFISFQSDLESKWKSAVTADVTANLSESNSITQQNIESIRTTVANFQGDLAGISKQISDATSALNSHLDAYHNLANRVTVVENQWTSGQGTPTADDSAQDIAIGELQADVKLLKEKVNTISTNTTTLINNTNSSLNTLFQNLYGANQDGSSGDIRDSITSIEQLRSQYDYLYDAIHDLYDGINSEVQKATSSLYSQLNSALRSDLESQIAALADKYNVSAEWTPGDYVLVAQDQTITTDVDETTTFPSTMYVVVPGMTPLDSKYVASYYDVYVTDLSTPINRVNASSGTSNKDVYNEALNTYDKAVATLKRQVPTQFVYGYELGGNDVQELASEDDLPDVYNSNIMLEELYESTALIEGVRGVPGKDYFVLRYRFPVAGTESNTYVDSMTGETYENIQCQVYRWYSVFFTLNLVSDKVELDLDNPIILSGGTPYAEESRVGGFLNVGSDVYGGGYVSRDAEGHLRLNDFELLVAGVTAYQLGEDRVEGSGLDISDLQDIFDQYINQRIAFPNDAQLYKAAENNLRTDEITIELNIGSTSEGTLNIYDIDSRFNTSVHLKISGSATENVLINITNCARLRITMDPTSSPTIILNNVCLYYDADILDRISQISSLSLWYTKYSDTDPELEVDGMTVIYQGKLEAKGTERYWTPVSSNDNIYAYALRQITFASDGSIIGMGIAITDNTTANVHPNSQSIFASTFTLPQSIGFSYPVTRLTKQIKVTGDFVTAYRSTENNVDGYIVKDTNFTILTQKYMSYASIKEWIQGVISFFTRTYFVEDVQGVDQTTLVALDTGFAIDGWESGAYHIFYGGAVE